MINLNEMKQLKKIEELLDFGVLNIDKPSGPTSFNISDYIRKKLNLKKTSHFGTLDPKVTGVLPIALGRACRLTGFFLGKNKSYIGIMRFHDDVEIEKVKKIIREKFLGEILQKPPVKSRVKRIERTRNVFRFEILEKKEKDFLFFTEVQGGTYIRKLIDDLGKEIGIGAHMLELRRTQAGIFDEDSKNYPLINLYDFDKAVEEYKKGSEDLLRDFIVPGEIISELHPIVEIKKDNLKQIFTGKPIHKKDLKKQESFRKDEILCVFCENKFVGIYKVVNQKDIFAKAEFVMQPIQ
jgi:H/ACA ribonucleoprotein complex subunit 4